MRRPMRSPSQVMPVRLRAASRGTLKELLSKKGGSSMPAIILIFFKLRLTYRRTGQAVGSVQ
jgi:hypothetical protein